MLSTRFRWLAIVGFLTTTVATIGIVRSSRSESGIDDHLTVTYLGGKEPVRAICFEVEGERMEFGQRFSAGEDWLKTLTIGIQNTSGKVVTYIDIGVFVPRHNDQNKAPPFHFSLFSGDKQAALKMEDSGLLFEPSSSPDRSVAVRMGLDEFTSIRSSLSKLGYPSKIGAIELQIEEVVFSDGTVWSLGRWYRTDPSDRRKLIPIGKDEGNGQKVVAFSDLEEECVSPIYTIRECSRNGNIVCSARHVGLT